MYEENFNTAYRLFKVPVIEEADRDEMKIPLLSANLSDRVTTQMCRFGCFWHTAGASTPDTLGNATADRLAARGRSGSSGELVRPNPAARCLRRTCSQSAQVDPVRRPKRWRRGPALSRDPRRFPYATTPLSAAHRLVLYQLASKCRRARCPPATAVFPGPCGGLICSCFGCRHPELPTWSWDLPVVSWGVVFSVGGATLVSLVLGNHLPIHLTPVINHTKIFGTARNGSTAECYNQSLIPPL